MPLSKIAMNICVDIGNTNARAGIFDGHKLLEVKNGLSDRGIISLIRQLQPGHVIIGSVRKGVGRIMKTCEKLAKTMVVNHRTPLPFTNGYASPETLGLDRIAAVAGGHYLYAGRNCLIIDIGTCITYDMLDQSGVYHGGGISPGVEMRLKAMHKFTSGLPHVKHKGLPHLIGKTTKECMLSGATLGAITEVEGIIYRYEQFFENLIAIMCGGGANFFESKIKGNIFAVPNLVLEGLNQVLRYNLHA
jgi:type III pantothenate kinase